MKFNKTEIDGCFIIEPSIFSDKRGVLRRHFDADKFEAISGKGVFAKYIPRHLCKPHQITRSAYSWKE